MLDLMWLECVSSSLQDEGIDAMDWPARSPDLNPIEHIWDIMSRSIHQRHVAPQTVQELADALVQAGQRTGLGLCGLVPLERLQINAGKTKEVLLDYAANKINRPLGPAVQVSKFIPSNHTKCQDHLEESCRERAWPMIGRAGPVPPVQGKTRDSTLGAQRGARLKDSSGLRRNPGGEVTTVLQRNDPREGGVRQGRHRPSAGRHSGPEGGLLINTDGGSGRGAQGLALDHSAEHQDDREGRSEERPDETVPAIFKSPRRLIVWGEGIRTWSPAMQKYFIDEMPTYNVGCNIEALISPNKKYDAVVKMTANVLGIESILENPETRAAGQYIRNLSEKRLTQSQPIGDNGKREGRRPPVKKVVKVVVRTGWKKPQGASDEERQPLPTTELGRFGDQVGFKAYHWIGDPWDTSMAHALLVLTDDNLKVRNRTFRTQLADRAGKKFQDEVEERRTRRLGEAEEQRQVVMISGNRLPYYAVMCLPIEEYPGKEKSPAYREDMLKALNRGVDSRAKEFHLRRVVICVDGLRSGHMQWEEAEKTAMALVNLHMRMPGLKGSVNELVSKTRPRTKAESPGGSHISKTRPRRTKAESPDLPVREERK
ncbi:hypothetical protein L3Q82_006361 [Scortum barcoo]|uniref:Uncharacterized protein n=1 Tax=Scortum barcoo TaxID=214431 RepID=A0ACB8WYM6_9TELE|nr:hypothetical protein L3Q82_006361 [Scortum barcoo]